MPIRKPQKCQSDERRQAVAKACADEIRRFNEALSRGAQPVTQTAFGAYRVLGISPDFVLQTCPQGARPNWANTRSFYIANDGRWAELLRQAGVERHPLFREGGQA